MLDEDDAQVAARCLRDARYARKVLAGRAHPEVRAALASDLETALEDALDRMLNPQPLPPMPPPDSIGLIVEGIWAQWSNLPRTQVQRLAETPREQE